MRRCIGGGVHGPAQSRASKPGPWLWQEGFHPFLRSWLSPNFVSNGSSASWGAAGSLDLPQSQRESQSSMLDGVRAPCSMLPNAVTWPRGGTF